MHTHRAKNICLGFTMLELIAVLIILGIMGGLAIANYASLSDETERAAARGALGEAKSALSMALGKLEIDPNLEFTSEALIAEAVRVTEGDNYYQFDFSNPDSAGVITITVTRGSTSVTGQWTIP